MKKYDFGGWATVYDVKCSDGRTIAKGAFKEADGNRVPLIWNHDHKDPKVVVGHADLNFKDRGVYALCSFNDTELGKHMKELVSHGDITSLSIYANKLVQKGSTVEHGLIREVSLVLAGANPGAFIDNVMAHGELSDDEAQIYNDEETFELDVVVDSDPDNDTTKGNVVNHAEEDKQTDSGDASENNTGETKTDNGQNDSHENEENQNDDQIAHKEKSENEETVADIYNSLTDKQKTVVNYMIGVALDKSTKESKSEDKKIMKHNAFQEQEVDGVKTNVEITELSHSDFEEITAIAHKTNGSFKEAMNEFAIKHSITNIEALFPEEKAVGRVAKVDDDNNWVAIVMNGIGRSPFSRVKSRYLNLTGDDARARGYVKGRQKVEEVIVAAKRSTSPQTVYKLQKLDRDDVIDITDVDVVSLLKGEMREKLQAELARAILYGDGRSSDHNDKISEDHIRSVANDSNVYTISQTVGTQSSTPKQIAELLVDQAVEAQDDYKGSGNTTMFIKKAIMTQMLLLKDSIGHRLFKSKAELATYMSVNRIVDVPNSVAGDVYAIIIDLKDYNVGTDRKGETTMFDDFDLNLNKYEYLIETRCSGANVEPYSAIVFKKNFQ